MVVIFCNSCLYSKDINPMLVILVTNIYQLFCLLHLLTEFYKMKEFPILKLRKRNIFQGTKGGLREDRGEDSTFSNQSRPNPYIWPSAIQLVLSPRPKRKCLFLSGKHSINNADYTRKATDKAFYYPTWGPCDFLYGRVSLSITPSTAPWPWRLLKPAQRK